MAEYPSRACGPCPHLAQFAKVEGKDIGFLAQNTTPEPVVKLENAETYKKVGLGTTVADLKPDLTVSPVKATYDKEQKTAFPSQIAENEKNKYSCYDRKLELPAPPGCCCNVEGIVSQPSLKSALRQKKGMHATVGRFPPNFTDPSATPPVPNDLRPVPEEHKAQTTPCYLPQPNDALPHAEDGSMDPIGPWATGRVDWGPLAGLTGTRPVVDKYSITRYSEGDWRAHNKEVVDKSGTELHRANLVDWNGRQCLEQTQADVDKNQEDSTKRLNQREMELHRWKCELERAISAASEEIGFMEEQRKRLKQASSVLTLPESISGECLQMRTGRMDAELVRDEVEEELIKETALCAEIRDIFSRTLKDVEHQLLEDKTAKQRLEYDWSDKKISHDIDLTCMALNNKSTILMFKPGSVCFPEEQSSNEYWEHFTRETLMEGEATRQRSVTLRGTLDAVLTNAARDLRTQADKVELALARRIACTQEIANKMENDLRLVLRRLADVETLIADLRAAIRRADTPMKKAHTRLDNRLRRPRVENCRDNAHFGLMEEVKSIGENVAALQGQLKQAESSQEELIKVRGELEREIMLKRKTLEIDGERTQLMRSYYPSAAALSGHA